MSFVMSSAGSACIVAKHNGYTLARAIPALRLRVCSNPLRQHRRLSVTCRASVVPDEFRPSTQPCNGKETLSPTGVLHPLDGRRALITFFGMEVASTFVGLGKAKADDEEDADAYQYDENGVMIGLESLERKVQLREVPLMDGAKYQVPVIWKSVRNGNGWDDPVNGPQVQEVSLFTAPCNLTDITELGKIAQLKLDKLPVPEELRNADLISLRSTNRSGQNFYEWDLAASPKDCPAEQQLVKGLCFPDRVILLSASVYNRQLYVLQVLATPQQWQAASQNIKNLRSTFAVS